MSGAHEVHMPVGRFLRDAAVWALLILALGVRIGWVAHTHGSKPTIDAADYDRHGHSIADGHGYPPSEIGVGPSAYRPPAYPFFLAAIYKVTGRGWQTARYVETLLATLTVALIGLLAWRFWGRRVGLIALALAAIYFPLVNAGTALVSEALFVPLVLGTLVTVLIARDSQHRLAWAALAGFLAGLAMLTRGNGFLLLIPLVVALWPARGTPLRSAAAAPALLVAVALLTVAPWTIRNAIVLDAFVPVTTETGLTMAGTYSSASAHYRYAAAWVPPTFDPKLLPLFRQKLDPGYTGPKLDEIYVSDKLRHAAFNYIGDHPLYVFKVVAANTLRLAGLSGNPRAVIDAEEPPQPDHLGFVSFYVIALLAIVGVFSRRRRDVPGFVWLVPVLMASSVLVIGWIRFRAPIDPFLTMLAALGIASFIGAIASRRPHRSPTALPR